ncbi:MAG: tetratricopeptide repeat protein, partial [Oligoflexales bacterium]|nr:tetratricopeptide repeat protein [Oligoflexales bacterium]
MKDKIKSKYLYYHVYYMISILFFILCVSCVAFDTVNQEEKKKAEILNTQKALVISFLNKGLPGMALKELKKLLPSYPDDADFKNLMGLTQLALGSPDQAIGYFKAAYAKNKQISVALNLSSAYIESKQYKKAINFLLDVKKLKDTETYPHPERIEHNIGFAFEQLNDFPKAEKYYLKALKENPNFYITLMRVGQLYDRLNKPQKASQHYLRAKELCEECFDPVNGLIMNYLARSEADKATELLDSYLENKEISPS